MFGERFKIEDGAVLAAARERFASAQASRCAIEHLAESACANERAAWALLQESMKLPKGRALKFDVEGFVVDTGPDPEDGGP